MAITSINPATGKTIKTYDEMTPEQAAAAVAQAHETWRAWRATSFAERVKPMKKTAEMLRKRKDELAKLMAVEMGKPLMQGAAEVEKCAWACDYYADNAEAHLAPDVIKTEGAKSYVAFEPLGVVLAIMPWNFPLWQGLSVRRACAHGRQRRRTEARLERAGLRARHRRDLQPGRLP